MTTMDSLSNSLELTSTFFTIAITNSSSSSSTLNTLNPTQNPTSPGVTLTSTNSAIINSTTMISEGVSDVSTASSS
jgi:hypothetical protein